jgi:hypothetical protein
VTGRYQWRDRKLAQPQCEMLGEVCVTVRGGQCVSRPWLLDASPPSPRSQFILCSGTKGHWFTTRASQLLLVILANMSDALAHACNRTTSCIDKHGQPDKMCMHAVPFTLKQRLSAYFNVRSAPCRKRRSGLRRSASQNFKTH